MTTPKANAEQQKEDPAPAPGLLKRVLQVFWAPGKLFSALRENPRWGGAFVVVILVQAFVAWATPEAALQAQAQKLEIGLEAMRTFQYLVAPFTAVVITVLAGLILLVGNLMLGGKAGFKQAMAVSSHALLIHAVGSLLVLPLMYATGQLDVTLGMHLLTPFLEEGYFFRVLKGLGVFSFWSALVLGRGSEQICFEGQGWRMTFFFLGGWLGMALLGAMGGG